MKHLLIALVLCLIPMTGWAIDEGAARMIAEEAAGCGCFETT